MVNFWPPPYGSKIPCVDPYRFRSKGSEGFGTRNVGTCKQGNSGCRLPKCEERALRRYWDLFRPWDERTEILNPKP